MKCDMNFAFEVNGPQFMSNAIRGEGRAVMGFK